MKHFSFSLENTQEYKKALKKSFKKRYKSKLIQVFTSSTNKKELKKILQKISNDFHDALIIGATTAGEISNAKMLENSTVISLSLFKKTKLKANFVQRTNKSSGEKLAKELCSKNTKALIVLSEGLQDEDSESFIKAIKKESPQVLLAGGLAADNLKFEKTYIFYKNKILENGAVGVSLSGKNLFAQNRYNLNWTAIGKKFIITSSTGNVVHEIDGQSALSIFQRYLGHSIFKNGAASLSDFQLLYQEGDITVSRTPLRVQGSSLIFAGKLREGQEVQFGFSNPSTVMSNSSKISTQLSKKSAEAIYIYSCMARKRVLKNNLESEFSNFNTLAPTSGFFTYGEFYSANKTNVILNSTTTILILSEKITKNTTRHISKIVEPQSVENSTFNALTHFIEQTSSQLKENLELLEQYKTAVDVSSLVSKTDVNGYITFVNDNFCKISGYTKEELLGKNHNIIKDENMSAFIFDKMWQTISNGKVWRGNISNKAKDGSIYYVSTTIIPILDTNAKIVEYIAIRQDITKQIHSKQRIKEKEKLIKAIFDNQDSIVIYTSKKDGMLNVNKKLFYYLDYSSLEAFKAKHYCICELFIDEEGYTNPQKYPNWIEDIASGETQADKAKILIKDGTVHTFKIIIKKLEDEYIINMYDITELQSALEKAHASEQAKSIFLANMSHEIRTPLNGILGFAEILSKKDLEKDIKRYVDIMQKSGQTLLSVVNDILDFSKIESGQLTLFTHESNLFDEMEAAVATFASSAKNKQIEYYTYIDTKIPKTLVCDIQRIKQVLNNLVSNAIKFTPNLGGVHVNITLLETKNDEASIRFSVRDTGIGIAKEKQGLVFDSFSQADNSISREFGGTGLGLSISSQFIEMMGSKLELQSQEKKGSEFHFTLKLPVVDEENAVSTGVDIKQTKIQLFSSDNKNESGINDIVISYLDAWNYSFTKIYSIKEVNAETNILIISAKLFEELNCEELFSKFENLQLIYIEGGQNSFNSNHERFHHLEQPMTGSALFNTIITLTNTEPKLSIENSSEDVKHFSGNILIAEDNETNQILISMLLKEKGLKYTIVNNGQAALDEAFLDDYDIIFMDINMPIMDGITATKLLREKNYNKTIVSLSANVIDSDIEIIKNAGVDDTLNKPIITHELDKILSTYLNTSTHFDTVDPQKVSQSLSIENLKTIEKLLISFIKTAESIMQKIEKEGLNKNLLHNVKGVAGNLRFNELYTLAKNLEDEIDKLSEKELQTNKALVISHFENLLKQIKLIYK